MSGKLKRQVVRRTIDFKLSNNDVNQVPLEGEMLGRLVNSIDQNICSDFGIGKLYLYDLSGMHCIHGMSSTLLSHASLKGRDVIVASLLRAGACPTFRNCSCGRHEYNQAMSLGVRTQLRLRKRACAVWIVKFINKMRERAAACCQLLLPCGHLLNEDLFWVEFCHLSYWEDVLCPQCGEIITTDYEKHADDDLSCEVDVKARTLERFNRLPDSPSKSTLRRCFRALPPAEAASYNIGEYKESRLSEFLKCVTDGNCRRLRAIVSAGVDLDWKNEYGQTALHLAVWYRERSIARLLFDFGASIGLPDNAGNTVIRTNDEFLQTFLINEILPFESFVGEPKVQVLIPFSSAHIGAGSLFVDGLIDEEEIQSLVLLYERLPVAPPEKMSCSSRSYYCDTSGVVRSLINRVLCRLRDEIAKIEPSYAVRCSEALPQMRFLAYADAGGSLAPHLDLSRSWESRTALRRQKNDSSELSSTHTFILYLSDCEHSGHTHLLQEIPSRRSNISKEENIVASVRPKRGRFLMFPHLCPHSGGEVLEPPKLLLRGELI